MKKHEAIKFLGGTVQAAADSVGVSYQAVYRWPDELPTRIADRVYAAMYRKVVEQVARKPRAKRLGKEKAEA